jgi:DNA-binding NtrC family response regulator
MLEDRALSTARAGRSHQDGLVVLDVAGDESALATIRELRSQFPNAALAVVLDPAPAEGGPAAEQAVSLRQARAQFERAWISATLVRHHGRVDEAAKALGIQRTNLYRKVRQLKVPRSLMAGRR